MPPEIYVAVTNKNKDVFADMYDGVPYTFEPNKTEFIPISAARHIFGYGSKTDREGALRRLDRLQLFIVNPQGQRELVDTREEGMEWLANFEIRPTRMIAEPEEAPTLPEDEFFSKGKGEYEPKKSEVKELTGEEGKPGKKK